MKNSDSSISKSFENFRSYNSIAVFPRCINLSSDHHFVNSAGVDYYWCYRCNHSCNGFYPKWFCEDRCEPDKQLTLDFIF